MYKDFSDFEFYLMYKDFIGLDCRCYKSGKVNLRVTVASLL